MVGWQGHKMSKSRGNLVFVSALRHAGTDPNAIRLALLAHHYRTDWTWTEQGLVAAEQRLALWRSAVTAPHGPTASTLLEQVRAALADDLGTPAALDAIDAWAMAAVDGAGDDGAAPPLVRDIADALLGVRL
jgi:L-cysteine:1D-myo-inositol 2-amino-2-deoxy-alpha-D-glucopyranoside ligase